MRTGGGRRMRGGGDNDGCDELRREKPRGWGKRGCECRCG
jgi:hypothetical protein